LKEERLEMARNATRTIQVTLKTGEDGWYVVQCVELPAAISQGRTKEEALANIREAITLVPEELQSRE
jgi:predicted RNase H-like HicB family nuclease